MFDLAAYLSGLTVILGAALVTWLLSNALRDVSIVDSLWGPLFALAAVAYLIAVPQAGPRTWFVVTLVALWAARLAAYITWRNWGEPEDLRYQAMRRNNSPYFAIKSLYLVFALQGILAWIVSLPLLAAIASHSPIGALDYAGIGLWAIGMVFEAGGDWQLARFKARPENRGKVMDRGFWRYTRHPNYFGEICIWWGFYLIALAAGGWWSILSPLVMSFLLVRISGVALLERDIGERRPGYHDYVKCTNALFPGPPRKTRSEQSGVRSGTRRRRPGAQRIANHE